MKKIYGILMLGILLFAAGCKQDEPVLPTSLQNVQLIGKWYLTSLVIDTDVDGVISTSIVNNYTDKDYFIFKANNEAEYSSSAYGKSFQGYYSANSNVSPTTLSYKSGTLFLKYFVESINLTGFTVYTATTSTVAGVTTTVTNHYNYSK